MFNIIKKALGIKDTTLDDVEPCIEKDVIADFYANHGNTTSLEDLDNLRDPIIYGNPKANKTMLLMDDQESVFYLYDLDFETIKKRHGYDVLNEFKIVRCDGPDAGFIASKYIRDSSNEIVVAILDLTLGKIIKLENNQVLLYDGVDIALELIELHVKCKIGLCTAHMTYETNPAISSLINKFNTATGHNLLDYTFSKNSDRAVHIFDMISDIENNHYTDYSTDGTDATRS